MKALCILVFLTCQLYRQPSLGIYLQDGTVGGQNLSEVWPELTDSETFSGQPFKANVASSNLSDFGVQFTISEVGSQSIPRWLAYQQDGYHLEGLPLDSDIGVYQLLVLAIRTNESSILPSEPLGAQRFQITVISRENRLYCQGRGNPVFVNYFLSLNATHFNSTQRIKLYQDFSKAYKLSQNSGVYFREFSNSLNHTSNCEVIHRSDVLFWESKGSFLAINWFIDCGLNSTWNKAAEKVYNISNSLGGSFARYPVIGWRIVLGNDGRECSSYIHRSPTSTLLSSVYPTKSASVISSIKVTTLTHSFGFTIEQRLTTVHSSLSFAYSTEATVVSPAVHVTPLKLSTIQATLSSNAYGRSATVNGSLNTVTSSVINFGDTSSAYIHHFTATVFLNQSTSTLSSSSLIHFSAIPSNSSYVRSTTVKSLLKNIQSSFTPTTSSIYIPTFGANSSLKQPTSTLSSLLSSPVAVSSGSSSRHVASATVKSSFALSSVTPTDRLSVYVHLFEDRNSLKKQTIKSSSLSSLPVVVRSGSSSRHVASTTVKSLFYNEPSPVTRTDRSSVYIHLFEDSNSLMKQTIKSSSLSSLPVVVGSGSSSRHAVSLTAKSLFYNEPSSSITPSDRSSVRIQRFAASVSLKKPTSTLSSIPSRRTVVLHRSSSRHVASTTRKSSFHFVPSSISPTNTGSVYSHSLKKRTSTLSSIPSHHVVVSSGSSSRVTSSTIKSSPSSVIVTDTFSLHILTFKASSALKQLASTLFSLSTRPVIEPSRSLHSHGASTTLKSSFHNVRSSVTSANRLSVYIHTFEASSLLKQSTSTLFLLSSLPVVLSAGSLSGYLASSTVNSSLNHVPSSVTVTDTSSAYIHPFGASSLIKKPTSTLFFISSHHVVVPSGSSSRNVASATVKSLFSNVPSTVTRTDRSSVYVHSFGVSDLLKEQTIKSSSLSSSRVVVPSRSSSRHVALNTVKSSFYNMLPFTTPINESSMYISPFGTSSLLKKPTSTSSSLSSSRAESSFYNVLSSGTPGDRSSIYIHPVGASGLLKKPTSTPLFLSSYLVQARGRSSSHHVALTSARSSFYNVPSFVTPTNKSSVHIHPNFEARVSLKQITFTSSSLSSSCHVVLNGFSFSRVASTRVEISYHNVPSSIAATSTSSVNIQPFEASASLKKPTSTLSSLSLRRVVVYIESSTVHVTSSSVRSSFYNVSSSVTPITSSVYIHPFGISSLSKNRTSALSSVSSRRTVVLTGYSSRHVASNTVDSLFYNMLSSSTSGGRSSMYIHLSGASSSLKKPTPTLSSLSFHLAVVPSGPSSRHVASTTVKSSFHNAPSSVTPTDRSVYVHLFEASSSLKKQTIKSSSLSSLPVVVPSRSSPRHVASTTVESSFHNVPSSVASSDTSSVYFQPFGVSNSSKKPTSSLSSLSSQSVTVRYAASATLKSSFFTDMPPSSKSAIGSSWYVQPFTASNSLNKPTFTRFSLPSRLVMMSTGSLSRYVASTTIKRLSNNVLFSVTLTDTSSVHTQPLGTGNPLKKPTLMWPSLSSQGGEVPSGYSRNVASAKHKSSFHSNMPSSYTHSNGSSVFIQSFRASASPKQTMSTILSLSSQGDVVPNGSSSRYVASIDMPSSVTPIIKLSVYMQPVGASSSLKIPTSLLCSVFSENDVVAVGSSSCHDSTAAVYSSLYTNMPSYTPTIVSSVYIQPFGASSTLSSLSSQSVAVPAGSSPRHVASTAVKSLFYTDMASSITPTNGWSVYIQPFEASVSLKQPTSALSVVPSRHVLVPSGSSSHNFSSTTIKSLIYNLISSVRPSDISFVHTHPFGDFAYLKKPRSTLSSLPSSPVVLSSGSSSRHVGSATAKSLFRYGAYSSSPTNVSSVFSHPTGAGGSLNKPASTLSSFSSRHAVVSNGSSSHVATTRVKISLHHVLFSVAPSNGSSVYTHQFVTSRPLRKSRSTLPSLSSRHVVIPSGSPSRRVISTSVNSLFQNMSLSATPTDRSSGFIHSFETSVSLRKLSTLSSLSTRSVVVPSGLSSRHVASTTASSSFYNVSPSVTRTETSSVFFPPGAIVSLKQPTSTLSTLSSRAAIVPTGYSSSHVGLTTAKRSFHNVPSSVTSNNTPSVYVLPFGASSSLKKRTSSLPSLASSRVVVPSGSSSRHVSSATDDNSFRNANSSISPSDTPSVYLRTFEASVSLKQRTSTLFSLSSRLVVAPAESSSRRVALTTINSLTTTSSVMVRDTSSNVHPFRANDSLKLLTSSLSSFPSLRLFVVPSVSSHRFRARTAFSSPINQLSSSVYDGISKNPIMQTTAVSVSSSQFCFSHKETSSFRLASQPVISLSVTSGTLYVELFTKTLDSYRNQYTLRPSRYPSLIAPTPSIVSMAPQTTAVPGNSAPVVFRALPKLNISTCEYLFLKIPDDTFLDKEDGRTKNLTLRLLTKDFRELRADSWISFDPSQSVVYGVPLTTKVLNNSKRSDFEYMLSAEDSGGRVANTTLAITVFDEPYLDGQRISIAGDAYFTPLSLIPVEIIKLVSKYLYGSDRDAMKILNVTVVSGDPGKVYLTWSDCKAVREVCDVRRVEKTSKLIRVSSSFVNPQFMIALMPKFVLRDVSEVKFGMCLNEPPLATRNVLLVNITCCEKFCVGVPHDLFYDKEDGNSRNLSLTMRYPNRTRLGYDTWIDINDTSKVIEGVVTFGHAQMHPGNFSEKFLLIATDSGKLETNVTILVVIHHPLPSSNYHVTFILKRLESPRLSVLEEIFRVIDGLRKYFGDKSSESVRVLSYQRQDLVTIFSWTNASLSYKPCDLVAVANISAKLKDESGNIRDMLKSFVLPEFEVQFVFEERLGHCKEGANENPRVLRPGLWLQLNKSFGYFELKIPADTFYDLEDGDTRNLKLSLLSTSFDLIPKDSWIVLNRDRQLIYGLPDETTNQVQSGGGFRFLLVAQDRAGKIASSTLHVKIPKTVQPLAYQVTIRVRSYLDISLPCVDHVIKFLEKLNSFTGEEDVRVINYNISKTYPADVKISWTSLTGSFNSCDHEIIERRFSRFSEKGLVTKDFSEVLLPYFIVQELHLKLLGSCGKLPNEPPVVLSPVPVLNVSAYRIFEFQLPEKMFFDKKDGYTRNLSVDVAGDNNQKFGLSSWITFNASSQVLYGIATRTVAKQQPAKGYVINIVAMDSDENAVNTTMLIEIQTTKKGSLGYEIIVKMMPEVGEEFLLVYQISNFFSKLKVYLGNREDLLITNFTKDNTTLTVFFSIERFFEKKCDFSEIRSLKEYLVFQNDSSEHKMISNFSGFAQPSLNLTMEMAPDFTVAHIVEIKRGACLNTPPVVLRYLLSFVVASFSLFSIPVPPNTFYDAEDGFTSNLSVTLLSSQGESLPPDSWIRYDQTSIELCGVITSQEMLEQSGNNYSYLLLAEDRYGLKTNARLTIIVPGKSLDIGLKLNMILKSDFSSTVPQVYILKLLLTKIAAYFGDDSARFINVISFERGSGFPSTDVLSWSNTSLDSINCNQGVLTRVSESSRKSDNRPHLKFKEELKPEFDVLIVFEQRLGSCQDQRNSLPQALIPLLSLNISVIPFTFRYEIPKNTFYDAEDGNTGNLTLSLLDRDNQVIARNSSVQLNVPLQLIYGIFILADISAEMSQKSFVLVASDSGGKTASSVLRINLKNKTVLYNYQLNVEFNSYLRQSLTDVAHLINFQKKLRTFSAFGDMQLMSYSRRRGYPAKFKTSFVNSSTTTDPKSCNYDEITTINEILKGTYRQRNDFTASFLPEFVVNEISIQKVSPCRYEQNEAPRVNRQIPPINVSICEKLKFKIPEDTFLDKEDGNTRNLTLELKTPSFNKSRDSWIFLDLLSQTLYGIPSVSIIRNQSPGDYKFKIVATDSDGASTEAQMTIFIQDNIQVDSYRLTASARIPAVFRNQEHFVLRMIQFTEAIERFLSSLSGHMRIVSFDRMTSAQIMVTWSNCSLRYSPCDYEKIENIRKAAIYEKNLPQPRFIQFLAPVFILESVLEDMRGPCLNRGPVVNRELSPLTAKLCGRLEYTIPKDTFFDSEDGYTSNLSLLLFHPNAQPLGQDYWLTFNKSAQTIFGYLTVDAVKSKPKTGYEFLLNAKDRSGLSTNLGIKVVYIGAIPLTTYEVTVVLRAQFTRLPNSVEQLRIILAKLAGYTGTREETIRVHSFLRTSSNSSVSFLTWSNCTFSGSSCDVLGISETSKRLRYPNGTILQEFRNAFHPEFQLQFVFEQRLGICQRDKNFPPRVMKALEPVIIRSVCGSWEYDIPSDLFLDEEEGYTRNLTLSIKTHDFLDLPKNAWVQLERASQTLYGFPGFRYPKNLSKETFALIAADRNGKFATTALETVIMPEARDTQYVVTVGLLSYLAKTHPDVYHVKKFLEKLSLFLNVVTKSVKVIDYTRTIRGSGSKFLITWANCSSPGNVCNHDQIEFIRRKLSRSENKVDPAFSSSMLPFFVPMYVHLTKFGPCQVAKKMTLRLLRPIRKISVFSGSLLWYKIPETTFADDKNRTTSNFSLVLQFSNKTAIPSGYWLKFDNVSHVIYGVLIETRSWNNTFRLLASDQRGNEGFDVFEVTIEPNCHRKKLDYRVNMEIVFRGNNDNVKPDFLRKLSAYFDTLLDKNFTLLAINRTSGTRNEYMIFWSHTATCGVCDQVNSAVKMLSQNVFYSNGTIRKKFADFLEPEITLVNVSETRCHGETGPRHGVTMVKGGQDDRWLLYVVPIVTILIFLFLSLLFFVFRTFVCSYRGKKDEVGLGELPSSTGMTPQEILVTRKRKAPRDKRDGPPLTVVNEGFLGNYVNATPEIVLDKRVSPSKPALRYDLSTADQAESRTINDPPVYNEAVLKLAPDSSREKGRTRRPSSTTNIEMKELQVVPRTDTSALETQVKEKISVVDGKTAFRRAEDLPPFPYADQDVFAREKERLQASHSLSLESDSLDVDDEEDPSIVEEQGEIPVGGILRLPTPPDVGMLRLPPVPKPLGNIPASSLVNTPDHDSQISSPFQTPLLTSTPAHSMSTIHNIHDVRQVSTPSGVAVRFPGSNQFSRPENLNYPASSPLDASSPPSYIPGIENRSHLGVQSPVGFPRSLQLVPYVTYRNSEQSPGGSTPGGVSGSNVRTSMNDLHQTLGELRESVNRELDRREKVDRYLEYYINKR